MKISYRHLLSVYMTIRLFNNRPQRNENFPRDFLLGEGKMQQPEENMSFTKRFHTVLVTYGMSLKLRQRRVNAEQDHTLVGPV